MTSKSTREENVQAVFDLKAGYTLGLADVEILKRVARMALAAMDSEPVAYMTYKGYLLHAGDPKLAEYSEPMPLYADPRPASTPAAPVAWDYEWASCITCEGSQDFKRIIEREAPPEWAIEEGQARKIIPLYRHAQSAPECQHQWKFGGANKLQIQKQCVMCGRVELDMQPAPVVQCPFPCSWENLNKLAIQDAAFVTLALVAGEPATESIRQAAISNNDRLLKVISACRAAMLQAGNSPVIPDGLIAAVNRLLDSDGSRGCYSAIRCYDARAEVERLLAVAPQEVQGE